MKHKLTIYIHKRKIYIHNKSQTKKLTQQNRNQKMLAPEKQIKRTNHYIENTTPP